MKNEFKRSPDMKQIHFSCDGSISLLDNVDRSMFRVGDTASGTDRLDETMMLWTCVAIGQRGPAWTYRPWTEDLAQEAVKACDLMVVVNSPWQNRTPS